MLDLQPVAIADGRQQTSNLREKQVWTQEVPSSNNLANLHQNWGRMPTAADPSDTVALPLPKARDPPAAWWATSAWDVSHQPSAMQLQFELGFYSAMAAIHSQLPPAVPWHQNALVDSKARPHLLKHCHWWQMPHFSVDFELMLMGSLAAHMNQSLSIVVPSEASGTHCNDQWV